MSLSLEEIEREASERAAQIILAEIDGSEECRYQDDLLTRLVAKVRAISNERTA